MGDNGKRTEMRIAGLLALKQCCSCKDWLPHEEYFANNSGRNLTALAGYCKECCAVNMVEYRKKNKERTKGYDLWKLYRLRQEDYDKMFAEQGFACKACANTEPQGDAQGGRKWCVDHDHSCCPGKKSCGKCIRGIICSPCNKALGSVCDDVNHLLLLVKYLQSSNKRSISD